MRPYSRYVETVYRQLARINDKSGGFHQFIGEVNVNAASMWQKNVTMIGESQA